MSMSPMDLQSGVQSGAEIQRSQRVEPRRPEDAQRYFAPQFQKQARQREQSVPNANKAEKQGVSKDARGRGYGGASGKNGGGGQKQRDTAAQTPEEGGMLDVLA